MKIKNYNPWQERRRLEENLHKSMKLVAKKLALMNRENTTKEVNVKNIKLFNLKGKKD